MVRASWNGVVVAESEQTVVVEGNHYFPPESVNFEYLEDSPKTTVCPWKGTASYYDLSIDGASQPGAAWVYRDPSDAAAQIKDHVAFYPVVSVEP